jgi:hypothetical protein
MKRIFTLPAILSFAMALFVSNAIAQPGCAWAKKIAANNEEWGQAVATDHSGNVYYTGNFYSSSIQIGSTTLQNEPYAQFNYGSEVFLAKYDSCGNFKWAKRAGGNDETRVRGIATDAAGNVYICGNGRADTTHFGTVTMLNRALYDGFVAKYDANGVCQWVTRIDGDDQDIAVNLTVDQSGNIYVVGNFGSTHLRCDGDSVSNFDTNNNNDVFLLKLDNTGHRVWLRAGGGDSDDFGYGIGVDASGNVYAAGYHSSSFIQFGSDQITQAGYNDIFITKYDASGTEQWLRQVGNTDDDRAFSLATDAAGNSYITGFIGFGTNVSFGTHVLNNSKQAYGYYLAKFDAVGTAQWVQGATDYDNYTENHGAMVRLDEVGNPHVIGYYTSDSLTVGPVTLHNAMVDSFDVFVMKYKPSGVLQWARTFGSQNNEFGLGIAPHAHDVFVCGEWFGTSLTIGTNTLTSTNPYTGDAFIANNIQMNSILPELCLVTSDSTSTNNVLYWDKANYPSVDSFIVYRETSSGVYSRIGAQQYGVLSQFTDTARHVGVASGDPNAGTYRYKLQALDTAGTLSAVGPYHNTVYFVDNGGGTFTWNLYSVENLTLTPVSNYCLMRDNTHNGNWQQVACVSGTQGTLNDPQYAAYSSTADWRVYANGFNCTPTMRYANNALEAAIVKSKSNITNNRGIGVKENYHVQLFLFPNPAGNDFTIACEKELGMITLYNALGAVVYKQTSNNLSERIDISRLPAGMYSIQVQGKFMKLIKE